MNFIKRLFDKMNKMADEAMETDGEWEDSTEEMRDDHMERASLRLRRDHFGE